MYGAAGWLHTPGVPRIGAKLKALTIGKPRPRIARSESEYVKKPKYDKANQESARRHGVRSKNAI